MMYKITLEHTPEGETPKYYLTEFEISVDTAISILAGIVTQLPAAREPIEEDVPAAVPPKRRTAKKEAVSKGGCEECGSKRRHRATCSHAGQGSDPERTEVARSARPAPLSEEQFTRVEETQEAGDMISSEYARENDIPLREVNVAIFSVDYETYIAERKAA
jgi:hypothetical protein